MEILKNLAGWLGMLGGILGAIGGAIATNIWFGSFIVLVLLKLTSLISIPWFASIFVLSAIGTPLWLLFGGVVLYLLGIAVLFLSASLLA